jgi:hypothetical protein
LFKNEIESSLGNITLEWHKILGDENTLGIVAIEIKTPNGIVKIS